MRNRRISLHLTFKTWLALFALAMAVYIAVPYVSVFISTLSVLFMTALLSLLINPLADMLEQRRVPRMWTVLLVYAGAIVVGVSLLILIVPVITGNLESVAANSQSLITNVLTNLQTIPGMQSLLPQVFDAEQLNSESLAGVLTGAAANALGFVGSIGSWFFALFIIAILVFFLVVDPKLSRSILRTWVPERYHRRVMHLTQRASVGLSRWFVAQLCISAYWVVAYTLMLSLLGIPYALTIGVISGVLEFIPYLGGIIGSLLMVLSALTVDPWLAVWSIVWGIPVGIFGVNVVVPFFFSKAINVHPAAILLALFIGGQIGGILTALLTVPMVVVLTVLVREFRTPPGSAAERDEGGVEDAPPDTNEAHPHQLPNALSSTNQPRMGLEQGPWET
ncbi:MAG: AI-2E family transporter [Chloroflexota bacterium]